MKKAGIKRGRVNRNLPRTKIIDWGLNKTISQLDRIIDIIDKRR